MKCLLRFCLVTWFAMLVGPLLGDPPRFPACAKRILFLGDSITYSGHYIALLEAHFRTRTEPPFPELINLGLSSETCSGLSEPSHPFPRPDVHDRIDRALAQIQPDVVVACYGMNDGIYHPPSEKRFAAYRDGIDRIIEKVHRANAKLVLMTPPPFDPVPLKKMGNLKPSGAKDYSYAMIYEDYDKVLRQYAAWLMGQSERVEMVIDLHTVVSNEVAKNRKENPNFTLSPDGIHPDSVGHAVIAEAITKAWGLDSSVQPNPQLLRRITQRQRLMHAAWLTQVGHQRPDTPRGLPLEEAKAKAVELDQQITALSSETR